MKYLAYALLAVLLLGVQPAIAVAATTTKTTATTTAAVTAANQTRLTNLKTRGAAEIDRRLAALAKTKTKLTAATKLSDTNKQALSSQIDTEVASLTALKTKLAADTDLATARTDVQSIVTEYRVYRLMIPKVAVLAADDRLLAADATMAELLSKINARVASAQAAGKDVSSLQPKLTDMQTKLTDANTSLTAIATATVALTPGDFNANNKALSDQRDKLKTARTTLQAAAQDGKDIIQGLKAL